MSVVPFDGILEIRKSPVQITTNDSYASRRALIGRWATILGFVVLIAGMYVSLQQPPQPSQISLTFWIPWTTLIVGIILLNVGKYHTMRWGGNPRVDLALAKGLKGLDHRYHLYNFVPDLPAEHVLVTPQGIIVLEPRPFLGEIIHEGRTWTRPLNAKGLFQRFADGGLGNPTREAVQDVEAIQKTLRERLGDDVAGSIAVLPIIVLTNPRAKLTLRNPEVPVVTLADLRGAVRQLKDARKLTTDLQRQLERALRWEGPEHALSTTRSNS